MESIAQTADPHRIASFFRYPSRKKWRHERQHDEFRLAIAPFFVGETAAPRLQLLQTIVSDERDRLTVKNVRVLGDMTVINYAHRAFGLGYPGIGGQNQSGKALEFTTT